MMTHRDLFFSVVTVVQVYSVGGLFYGDSYPSTSVEVCVSSVFKPKCGHNEVVFIQNATYGRMKLGKCITIDMGFIGCHASVLDIVHKQCSGKQTCELNVPNKDLVDSRPCIELLSYLEVKYTCIPVISATDFPCSPQNILKVLPEQGIISSERRGSDCGSTKTVWLIEAKAGQKVNVTLINFGHLAGANNKALRAEPCGTYVRDVTSRKEVYLCDVNQMVYHVMMSLSNAVEVVVEHTEREHQFLLKYQMIGCPDPPVGVDSWTKREGAKVVIGCKDDDVVLTYKMTCVGTTWLGTYQNCSSNGDAIIKKPEETFSLSSLPRGLVITAVLAIALVVGTTIVVVGIFLVRRQRHDFTEDSAYSINNMDKFNHQPYRSTKDNTDNFWIDRPPVPNGTMQQQTPTLQRCYQYTGTPNVTPEKRHEYTHIWDRPLPAPESQHSC